MTSQQPHIDLYTRDGFAGAVSLIASSLTTIPGMDLLDKSGQQILLKMLVGGEETGGGASPAPLKIRLSTFVQK